MRFAIKNGQKMNTQFNVNNYLQLSREHSSGGRITVQTASRLKRLDLTKYEIMLLFVSSEAVESKLVRLKVGQTV